MVERVDGRGLGREEFCARFEDPRVPCVLTGLCDGWAALQTWEPELLAGRFPSHEFDVGRESCETVTLPALLAGWASGHAAEQYVFDASCLDVLPELCNDYAPLPPCFPRDDHLMRAIFGGAAAPLRPEWRWLLVGGPGSGFGIHVDPHATNAWNALVVGRKRWALLPPSTAEEVALGPAGPSAALAASAWFAAGGVPGALVFDQLPGEIVFVPRGWWHVVRNETAAVAVTQNWLGESAFAAACEGAAPDARALWRERAAELLLADAAPVATT